MFRPDSPLVSEVVPSPNVGERVGCTAPDLIVLHYTGMQRSEAALARLCDAQAQVSAHYLVFEHGRVVQMVPEAARAWHAGVSCWAGETDINSRSVGIEIANPGHDFRYPDFPDMQIDAVLELCLDIAHRHGIARTGLVAHSDVAPSRKQDPGERFPWKRFAQAGLGVWVEPAPLSDASVDGDTAEVRAALRRIGYCVEDAPGDAPLADVITAFQRHYRPARVDGIADASTRATLIRVASAFNASRQCDARDTGQIQSI